MTNEKDWRLWVALHQAGGSLTRVREMELEKHGLSVMQGAAIYIMLQSGKPKSVSEIAQTLIRDYHSVMVLLNRMCKHGFVEETNGNGNGIKKIKKYLVTDKGRDVYNKSRCFDIVSNVLSNLGENEKDTLLEQLSTIKINSIRETLNYKINKIYIDKML